VKEVLWTAPGSQQNISRKKTRSREDQEASLRHDWVDSLKRLAGGEATLLKKRSRAGGEQEGRVSNAICEVTALNGKAGNGQQAGGKAKTGKQTAWVDQHSCLLLGLQPGSTVEGNLSIPSGGLS